MTAHAIKLKIKVNIGAKINKNLFELEGRRFSFVINLITSAKL